MSDSENHVVYKAVADFTALSKVVRKAKKDIAELRKEEALLNSQSVAGSAASTIATGKKKKSTDALVDSFEKEAVTVQKSTANFVSFVKAARDAADATDKVAGSAKDATDATDDLSASNKKATEEFQKNKRAADETGKSHRRAKQEASGLGKGFDSAMASGTRLNKSLNKLSNWRPRLIPPFIALIPVIGGVLGLLNPLVAGLGAVGAAGIGLASSLGTIGGAAIGIIPALATLLSVVGALKAAFGGVGTVFKAATAAKKAGAAGGGGGGGPAKAELSRNEQLTRANEDYVRSIEDVKWAQDDLDDARADHIQRLKDLQKQIDRTAASEARAMANSQLSRENYANVMSDAGSTKGDKLLALSGITDADNDLQDVRDEAKETAKELAEMQRDGIAGDKAVIQATRRLTDALDAQRDAQLQLINTQTGANEAASAGAAALDEYKDAFDKLSPSAQKFVLALLGMEEAWTAVKKNVQEAFFSEFIDDIELLRNLLPTLNSLLTNTAGALGRVTKNFIALVTSPEWQSDLVLIGENNVPIIEKIGAGLLSLIDAFKDIAVVAGPFLIDLSNGFKEGAANWREMIAAARESGSLASYLEEVRSKMSQWWAIIKNVGKTLFNYSAAASDFGDWMTDGFEKMTEGWLKASEAARREGSPFKTYLEDIKPLLSEVKGLFADFFKWFGAEASDKENIAQFTEIISIIREDLGPALKRIFDILSESGVGEDLVHAVVSIVDAIATFLENGGIEGIKAFYDTVKTLFDFLNSTLASIPKPVLALLSSVFGSLAALTFFGLTGLIGGLLSLGKSAGLLKILKALPGLGKAGGAGGVGSAVGGAAKGAATAVGSGLTKGMEFIANLGTKVNPSAGAGAGKGFNLLTSIAKGAGRGAGIGAAASIVGTVAGDLISGGAATGSGGSGQRVGGNVLAGAASGAGIGALVGSVVPGVGTAIGAGVGGVVGAGVGLFTSEEADRDKFFEDTAGMFSDFFGTNLPQLIAGFGGMIWDGLTSFGDWIATGWDAAVQWFVDLPYNVGVAVGTLWGNLEDFGSWLTVTWEGAMLWFQSLPQLIADTAGNVWGLIMGIGPWLATIWQGFAGWLQSLPQSISATAGNLWRSVQGLGPWLATVWAGFAGWIQGLPTSIANTAGNIWRSMQGVGTWLSGMWTDIYNWAIGLPKKVGSAIGNIFSFVTGSFAAGVDKGKGRYNGGPIKRAGGGSVPGTPSNSDTVPAMLTPGEFVIRKAMVNRVGEDNLARFNSGVMSYAQLLNQSMANQPSGSKDKGGSGVSFLNGGGLVPSFDSTNDAPKPPDFPGLGGGKGGEGGGMSFGDIHIHNPVPEKSSDSLPRTIRKVGYIGSVRNPEN